MGFNENFQKFKQRLVNMGDSIFEMSEEATKNALVMPFFTLLGYDVFNPQEFMPEYTCDVGTKKGEKIDYAIVKDGDPIMLIEVKRCGMKLQKQQQSQLYRYFSVNHSRIAILTNGIQYNIYSDINAPNIMDDDPFLSFNLLEDDESVYIKSLEGFTSENFDVKEILSKAIYLKYAAVVEKTLLKDLEKPSDEIVKYFLSRPEIKTGSKITSRMINQHRELTAQIMRKVMGVTLNNIIAAPAVQQEQQSPGESEMPQVCSVVADMLSRYDIEFEYSTASGVNELVCSELRIVVPESKPDRYVIWRGAPGKVKFVHGIDKLEQHIANVMAMA